MIPSFRELNEKCQKPRYKEVGNWMVRKILRPAALPITWLLLHTPVTANQVTLAAILVGLWGNWLLASTSSNGFLWGTLLLQFWYLLDHVDGQIARYRGTSCLTGRFYDFLMHHIIHGTVLFGLGWYVWQSQSSNFWIFWTFLACFCLILFNLIYDIQYKSFFEKIAGNSSVQIKEKQHSLPLRDNRGNPVKKAFTILHKSCEMHVLMNILTTAALFEVFILPSVNLRFPLFIYYGLAVPALFLTKTFHIIKTKKIDQEFESHFSA